MFIAAVVFARSLNPGFIPALPADAEAELLSPRSDYLFFSLSHLSVRGTFATGMCVCVRGARGGRRCSRVIGLAKSGEVIVMWRGRR